MKMKLGRPRFLTGQTAAHFPPLLAHYLVWSPLVRFESRRRRLPTNRSEQNRPARRPSSSAAVLRSGRSVRCRRRTAGCRQSSSTLRSMATKAASVANWLIIIAVGVLPMPAATAAVSIALVHHDGVALACSPSTGRERHAKRSNTLRSETEIWYNGHSHSGMDPWWYSSARGSICRRVYGRGGRARGQALRDTWADPVHAIRSTLHPSHLDLLP